MSESRAMSESRRQIGALLFKPTSVGFIYRAPNPWIFGRTEHYVVNETQKGELLGILVAPRPVLRLAVIVAGILLWAVAMGTIAWAFSPHEDPTVGDVVIMIVLTFAALFLALHLALRHKLRRLQPILAGATRTTAVITSSEMRSAMNKTTSLKSAVFTATMFARLRGSALHSLSSPRHPLFSDVQSDLSVFLLALSTIMLIRFLSLAVGKMRRRKQGLKGRRDRCPVRVILPQKQTRFVDQPFASGAPLVGQQVFANSRPSCASSRFSMATSFPEALKPGPSHFAGQAAWKFHRIASAPVSSRRMTEPFFRSTWPARARLYHCHNPASPVMPRLSEMIGYLRGPPGLGVTGPSEPSR